MISATGTASARRVICATLVAANCAMPVAASATGLPNYPGATTQRISPGVRSATTNCGRTITVEKSFKASADPNTIAKWYGSRLPGSRTIDVSRLEDQEGAKTTSFEVFSADGSQTVVINRMQYPGGLAASAKMLGMDKTDIGVEGVSPPFPPGYLDLITQVAAGGASAERAKRQMKAECKGG